MIDFQKIFCGKNDCSNIARIGTFLTGFSKLKFFKLLENRFLKIDGQKSMNEGAKKE
jgi:hypothetical protein